MDQADFWYEGYQGEQLLCIRLVQIHPHKGRPPLEQTLVSRPASRLQIGALPILKPGIERVQALADISRSTLCCHSNETHALIVNLPNSAQLEGTPIIPPRYIRVVQ